MNPDGAGPDGAGTPTLPMLVSRLDQQDHLLGQFAQALQALLARTAHLPSGAASAVVPPAAASSANPAPAVAAEVPDSRGMTGSAPLPQRYGGEPSQCRGFLNQVGIYFEMVPRAFPTNRSKVGFLISLLSDKALAWANPLWENDKPVIHDYPSFVASFRRVFDVPARSASAAKQLLSIQQGIRTVAEYAIEFRTLAAEVGWNNEALVAAFSHGLSDALKDEVAAKDLPVELEALVSFLILIDTRLRERPSFKERLRRPPTRLAPTFSFPPIPPSPSTPPGEGASGSEPMQLGFTRLSEAERAFRRREGRCLYCGLSGHFLKSCPTRPGRRSHLRSCRGQILGGISSSPAVRKDKPLITVILSWTGGSAVTRALVDSGAGGYFIDSTFAAANSIPLQPRATPLVLEAIDGRPLRPAQVTHETVPVEMAIGAVHRESVCFQVISSPHYSVVLGFPWLQQHNPTFDWQSAEILSWSPQCGAGCIHGPVKVLCTSSDSVLPSEYHEYQDVFDKMRAGTLPPHRPYDCAIELQPDAIPPRGRVYPLSVAENKAMEEYVADALSRGHIRKSTSPAGAGFFFVKKKEGDLRPCIDYRGLNRITIKNAYPIPLITELFDRLKGATVFTKLDLRAAYNLVRIKEGDEWKTAFNTRTGHYEYLVMPFGLCNAPAVFQEFINDVFRDMLQQCVVVYLDDILVYSDSIESHFLDVRRVLQRLRVNGLFCKLEKCEFHLTQVTFLGYIISPEGFSMDPQKVSAVLQWPRPSGLRSIQRFLGFANYYRKFIRNFSALAKPISDLTKRGSDAHNWTLAAIRAFEALKSAFASAPILSHPNPGLPFVLEVDASETGVGALLSQRRTPDGLLLPCGFYSKKLSPAECNYEIGDRELLAIILALKEWRHLLEGSTVPVLILTDHKNLTYLSEAKRLTPRQARWALFLSRFNYVVSYLPGSKNVKADALSRQYSELSREDSVPTSVIPSDHILAAIRTNLTSPLGEQILAAQSDAPTVRPAGKCFVPVGLRIKLLRTYHNSKTAGHPGKNQMSWAVSRQFWWPSLRADVAAYVAACSVCAQNKSSRHLPLGLLHPIPNGERPWSHLAMDFIVELPASQGYTVILMVVDRFSKMCHCVPFKKLPTAQELASAFAREVFRLHGLPEEIVSDRGSQFVSRFWRAFCSQLGIHLSFSSAYHPQSNGAAERSNQALEQFLRCYISDHQDNWVDLLPWAEFARNSAINSSSGMSPFMANYGFQPSVLPESFLPQDIPAVEDHLRALRSSWVRIQESLRVSAQRQKLQADRRRLPAPSYQVGDRVWLSTRNLNLKVPAPKLAPRFVGPFRILRRVNPVAYALDLPPGMRISNVFHVSLLKPLVCNRYTSSLPRPRPIPVGNHEEYEISSILDSRLLQGRVQFLVHWRGYGPEERSWVSSADVHAPALLRAFHARFPQKPFFAPRRRGH